MGDRVQSDPVPIRFVPGKWQVQYLRQANDVRIASGETHNTRSRQLSEAVATVGEEMGNGRRFC
jgi:hypothetical protein